jgi:CTD small phosphatase-like protein 2
MSVNVVPTGRYSYHTHSHEENVIFSPTGTFKYEEDVYMTSNYQSSTLSDSSVDSVKSEDQESDIKSEEEDEEDFNSYLFMSGLPAYSTVRHTNLISISPNMFLSKQTLVLDLDETLVHCSVDPVESCDFVFPVTFNEVNYQVHVKKRPYVDYFLESVSKHFEVIVFTASQKIYADKLLDLLDPQKKIFAHRLFRDSCLGVCGNFVKDLRVVNRDLSKVTLSNSLLFLCVCIISVFL